MVTVLPHIPNVDDLETARRLPLGETAASKTSNALISASNFSQVGHYQVAMGRQVANRLRLHCDHLAQENSSGGSSGLHAMFPNVTSEGVASRRCTPNRTFLRVRGALCAHIVFHHVRGSEGMTVEREIEEQLNPACYTELLKDSE